MDKQRASLHHALKIRKENYRKKNENKTINAQIKDTTREKKDNRIDEREREL